MGHSHELLELIASKVARRWPRDQFQYLFEQPIAPGVGMEPDIQVRNATGELCCVVEIGYTRPEKLTAYRAQYGVKDVRWYDKEGHLHDKAIQLPPVVHQEHVVPVGGTFYALPVDGFPCLNCYHIFTEPRTPITAEELAAMSEEEREAYRPITEDEEAGHREEAWEEARIDTIGHLLHNGVRRLLVGFCDKCGMNFTLGPRDCVDVALTAVDVATFDESLKEWARAQRRAPADTFSFDYPEMLRWVKEQYELDISYDEFEDCHGR